MVIDAQLVQGLIAAQFPEWSHLPVRRVEHDGHDNRTFRLGVDMSVRLPSHPRYEAQVAKEQRWLHYLAPRLPLQIPEPLGVGQPSDRYPFRWSVNAWIEGDRVDLTAVQDLGGLAESLADFLIALQSIEPAGGPEPGPHNFHRGGPLGFYDGETREALRAVENRIDHSAATEVWETALAAPMPKAPTWLHGDLAPSNLLAVDGALVAVIDFGICGIGDPSCDLKMAWMFFDETSRQTFRERLGLDASTWARGRGWALWKSLKILAETDPDRPDAAEARRWVEELVSDHKRDHR